MIQSLLPEIWKEKNEILNSEQYLIMNQTAYYLCTKDERRTDQIHFIKKSSHHQRYLVHSFLIMSLGKSVILAWPGLVSVIN